MYSGVLRPNFWQFPHLSVDDLSSYYYARQKQFLNDSSSLAQTISA